MKKWFGILLLFTLLFSNGVLAEIIISEPEDVYNLGDRIYISADGVDGTKEGNFNINLICANNSINLVKIPARSFGSDQAYSLPYVILDRQNLELEDLNGILGECQIKASVGDLESFTKTFVITKEIRVEAYLDDSVYKPGETATLKIDAVKANGEVVNGVLEVINGTEFSRDVKEGLATGEFKIPDTIEAGMYFLTAVVYDSDAQGKLNEGQTVVSYEVAQVPTTVVLSLSSEIVAPESEFTAGLSVFDQSGKEMTGTGFVKLISPLGKETEMSVNTGEYVSFNFPSDASAGEWRVLGIFGEIGEERTFSVSENEKVEFYFEDSILVVRNIGNVPYVNKNISIKVADKTENLFLNNLGINETRKFRVRGGDGLTDVEVGDGVSLFTGQVVLTGSAVTVKDLKEVGIFKSYSVVWIFLILILATIGYILFRKYRKTKTLGETNSGNIFSRKVNNVKSSITSSLPSKVQSRFGSTLHLTNKSAHSQSLDEKSHISEDNTMIDLTNKRSGRAESTLVIKGEKYPTSVICLNVKNLESINPNSVSSLKKLIEDGAGEKGFIDWSQDHVFIIFSPISTKTYNNELLASKAAFKILKSLEAHNRRSRDKIEFNMAVHTGQLICSKEGSRLKYTGIGNTISFARKMADSDTGKLLVSDSIRKRMLRDLKVIRHAQIGENAVYSVTEIKNKEANEAKLKDLLGRMKEPE